MLILILYGLLCLLLNKVISVDRLLLLLLYVRIYQLLVNLLLTTWLSDLLHGLDCLLIHLSLSGLLLDLLLGDHGHLRLLDLLLDKVLLRILNLLLLDLLLGHHRLILVLLHGLLLCQLRSLLDRLGLLGLSLLLLNSLLLLLVL